MGGKARFFFAFSIDAFFCVVSVGSGVCLDVRLEAAGISASDIVCSSLLIYSGLNVGDRLVAQKGTVSTSSVSCTLGSELESAREASRLEGSICFGKKRAFLEADSSSSGLCY